LKRAFPLAIVGVVDCDLYGVPLEHISLYLLCAGAAVVNLPFGYVRRGLSRLSWPWLLAVHAPVPLVVVLRLMSHRSWAIVPLLVVCAVFGQLAGGMMRGGHRRTAPVRERRD